MRATTRQEISVNVPATAVWDFLADPRSHPRWMAKCTDVENIENIGPDCTYKIVYSLLGVPLRCNVRTLAWEPARELKFEIAGGLSATAHYSLQSERDRTLLNVTADYRIPLPILRKAAGSVVERIAEKELATGLETLKRTLEMEAAGALEENTSDLPPGAPRVEWTEMDGKRALLVTFDTTLDAFGAMAGVRTWDEATTGLDQPYVIIWDASAMKTYDNSARRIWQSALSRHKPKVSKIWLVSDRALIRAGARMMSAFTRIPVTPVAKLTEVEL